MLESLFERRRRGWRRRAREFARHATRARDANVRASFEAATLDGDGRRARRSAAWNARDGSRRSPLVAARSVSRRRGDARVDARNVLFIVVKRYYSSSQLSLNVI